MMERETTHNQLWVSDDVTNYYFTSLIDIFQFSLSSVDTFCSYKVHYFADQLRKAMLDTKC